jgi:hypothetical protein
MVPRSDVAAAMIEFARACDDIAADPAKSTKIQRLAQYLRSVDGENIRAAARFVSGNPLAANDERKLAIGGRTLLAAARNVWSLDEAELSAAYRATGDLGEALARVAREPDELGLFAETLTPASFATMLDDLASASGKAAGRRRQGVCERAFRATRDPREVAYVVKILLGDLRIGLREGLVLDAIAAAFACDPGAVRRAAMAAGDVGAVALAARDGDLEAIVTVLRSLSCSQRPSSSDPAIGISPRGRGSSKTSTTGSARKRTCGPAAHGSSRARSATSRERFPSSFRRSSALGTRSSTARSSRRKTARCCRSAICNRACNASIPRRSYARRFR